MQEMHCSGLGMKAKQRECKGDLFSVSEMLFKLFEFEQTDDYEPWYILHSSMQQLQLELCGSNGSNGTNVCNVLLE